MKGQEIEKSSSLLLSFSIFTTPMRACFQMLVEEVVWWSHPLVSLHQEPRTAWLIRVSMYLNIFWRADSMDWIVAGWKLCQLVCTERKYQARYDIDALTFPTDVKQTLRWFQTEMGPALWSDFFFEKYHFWCITRFGWWLLRPNYTTKPLSCHTLCMLCTKPAHCTGSREDVHILRTLKTPFAFSPSIQKILLTC